MGGFDKARRCEALKRYGWKEVEDNILVPPDSLWQNKAKGFYVYDAIDLQGLLVDPKDMDDELKEFCGFEGDE